MDNEINRASGQSLPSHIKDWIQSLFHHKRESVSQGPTPLLRYYIYVSDAKVDMLYPQIPKNVLKSIASELRIDLKLLAVDVGATIRKEQTEETHFSKLKLVAQYLENHLKVGGVDDPQTYFKGRLPMRWGLISHPMGQKLVYFAGITPNTILGLGGSPEHVIGHQESVPRSGFSPSLLTSMFSILLRLEEDQPLSSSMKREILEEDFLRIVSAMPTQMTGPEQQVEFLAKTLLQDEVGEELRKHVGEKQILLGTPIYVALAN